MGCGASVDGGVAPKRPVYVLLAGEPFKYQEKGRKPGKEEDGENVSHSRRWHAAYNKFKTGDATVVLVLGPPGVDVSPICQRIARDFGFARLCVELFSQPGNQAEGLKRSTTLDTRSLSEGMLSLLRTMRRTGDKRILLDGFPRSTAEIEAFEDYVAPLNAVLVLGETSTNPKSNSKPSVSSQGVDGKIERPGIADSELRAKIEPSSEQQPKEAVTQQLEFEKVSQHAEEDTSGKLEADAKLAERQADVDSDKIGRQGDFHLDEIERQANADLPWDANFDLLKDFFQAGESDVILRKFTPSAEDVFSQVSAFLEENGLALNEEDLADLAARKERRRTAEIAREERRRTGESVAAVKSKAKSYSSKTVGLTDADRFRKEYPWVMPLKGIASFCVRLTERYWAWFDPKLDSDDESSDEETSTEQKALTDRSSLRNSKRGW